jgi:hypothetical protein
MRRPKRCQTGLPAVGMYYVYVVRYDRCQLRNQFAPGPMSAFEPVTFAKWDSVEIQPFDTHFRTPRGRN